MILKHVDEYNPYKDEIDNQKSSQENNKTPKYNNILIGGAILACVFIGGGIYYFATKNNDSNKLEESSSKPLSENNIESPMHKGGSSFSNIGRDPMHENAEGPILADLYEKPTGDIDEVKQPELKYCSPEIAKIDADMKQRAQNLKNILKDISEKCKDYTSIDQLSYVVMKSIDDIRPNTKLYYDGKHNKYKKDKYFITKSSLDVLSTKLHRSIFEFRTIVDSAEGLSDTHKIQQYFNKVKEAIAEFETNVTKELCKSNEQGLQSRIEILKQELENFATNLRTVNTLASAITLKNLNLMIKIMNQWEQDIDHVLLSLIPWLYYGNDNGISIIIYNAGNSLKEVLVNWEEISSKQDSNIDITDIKQQIQDIIAVLQKEVDCLIKELVPKEIKRIQKELTKLNNGVTESMSQSEEEKAEEGDDKPLKKQAPMEPSIGIKQKTSRPVYRKPSYSDDDALEF